MRRTFIALTVFLAVTPPLAAEVVDATIVSAGDAYSKRSSWYLVPPGKEMKVSKGKFTLKLPEGMTWQRWTSRPSDRGEIWTKDGIKLNELSFFGGVSQGENLYYGGYGEGGLPEFRKKMLIAEIPAFFENSNRLLLQSSEFEIGETQKATLGGHKAIRFAYHFTPQDSQITRKGEAVAAIVDGKLYLVNFVAPEIYYFDRDIAEVRKLVDLIVIPKEDKKKKDMASAADKAKM